MEAINTNEILNKDFERYIKILVRKYSDKQKEIYGSICNVEWHKYNKSRIHVGKIAYSWNSAANLLASFSEKPYGDYYGCGLEGRVPSFVAEFLKKRGWDYIRYDLTDLIGHHPKIHDTKL
jgi:hypothetical protein